MPSALINPVCLNLYKYVYKPKNLHSHCKIYINTFKTKIVVFGNTKRQTKM